VEPALASSCRRGVAPLPLAVAITLVVVPVTWAASAATAPSTFPSAARVIDRTLVCEMPGEGFPDQIRFMTVTARPRNQPQPGDARPRRIPPPLTAVSNGRREELRAFVRTAGEGDEPTGLVVLSRSHCRTSKLRVRLSAKGLRGGPTGRNGDSYRCDVPTRVLLRVRAEFTRPAAFSPDAEFPSELVAKGRIATAYVATTTLRGGAIALTSVSDTTGKARAFTAPDRCTRTK
jgi:hypothetical protein